MRNLGTVVGCLFPAHDRVVFVARKRRSLSPLPHPTPVAADTVTPSASPPPASLPPAGRWSWVISGLVVLHFAAVACSYLAAVQPSTSQQRALTAAAPYLQSLHWAPESGLADGLTGDGVPLYLARGGGAERVLRLQTQSSDESRGATHPSDPQWQPVSWFREDGSLRSRRQQRFLAALAQLGLTDQNALAGRLVLPLFPVADEADLHAATPIQLVRLPNLMTNVVQDNEPPPYQAVLLQTPEGRRVVRVAAPRLTAAATLGQTPPRAP